jgi:hypothetical protein
MSEEHFDDLYETLRKCFYDCIAASDETYAVKIGIILDHMNTNKLYLLKS